MLLLIKNIVILFIGFILLIKGADYFVDGASGVADKFGIPQLVIGLTIVAFGTSAPEAAISISAALKGSTGIAIGNVIGSNIMNILLILGITSCIVPLKVARTTVKYEIPFTILISIVLVVYGAVFGKMNFTGGIILWVLFICFFIYLVRVAKNSQEPEAEEQKHSFIMLIIFILGGLVAIVYGSNFTVDSATAIAKVFGVSDRIIGLTIVAFGTSLPELMTSVTAARKGKADIAIGNIIGSNIFNILFVLGTTALIKSVPFASKFIVDGLVCIGAAVLLYVAVLKDGKMGRKAGATMLVCYAAYFVYLLIG
ncbi:calcium/sodium antiporter [[Clostridium] polysaccharolyticum]|uniref:Cation:H+ antiporter n=1 Tax=[Clostridium] polysaccharolyticum TaxID=29364 RepID=A0A1I0DR93_9FIRM|nr:calcium/sodium antiporter [[Clostridium] polysaccharolyticum]SET34796.1 cation:H+ antiporter [[Clostridium] polysaccharolyticum]